MFGHVAYLPLLSKVHKLRDEFVSRLKLADHCTDDDSATELQKAMSAMIKSLREEDSIVGGGGGADLIAS
jgi:cysteine synthase